MPKRIPCKRCESMVRVDDKAQSALCSLCVTGGTVVLVPSVTTPKKSDGTYAVPVGEEAKKIDETNKQEKLTIGEVKKEVKRKQRRKTDENPTYRFKDHKKSQRGRKSVYGMLVLNYLKENETATHDELFEIYSKKKREENSMDGKTKQRNNFNVLMYTLEKKNKIERS